jgi:hypothetical protein
MHSYEKELVLSQDQIQDKVRELAETISRDYQGTEPVLWYSERCFNIFRRSGENGAYRWRLILPGWLPMARNANHRESSPGQKWS